MGFQYWFPPLSSQSFELSQPANDEAFETELYHRMMLCMRASEPVEILCADASRLSPAAFDVFLNPKFELLCSGVIALRFRHFTAANAQTFAALAEKLQGLKSLELLDGFTLDPDSVTVLSGLPALAELAVDDLHSSSDSPRMTTIAHLGSLKALERFAVPRCFLLEREIDAVIQAGNLIELAVANAYDEDGQRAIQDKHEGCTIEWGYLV
jgi:hypothetical protein